MVSGKSPEVRFAKTKMCKFHLQGKCAKGAGCSFAHGPTEMETSPDLYRTQLCMALVKTGKCKDSENCKYAHDRNQLRALPRCSDKSSYCPTKAKSIMQKINGQNKCGNSDTSSPKSMPLSCTSTPPSSPQQPQVSPAIFFAAVPVCLPVSMDMTADGQFVIGSPTSIGSPGVMPNFGLQWSPAAMYNLPYAPCEEPAIPGSPPVVERKRPGLVMGNQVQSAPVSPVTQEKFPGFVPDEMEAFQLPANVMQNYEEAFTPSSFRSKDDDADHLLGSLLTETMSETSTEGSDRDKPMRLSSSKSSADGESFDSMGSSIYSLPVPAFEQGFEVSIKNTFLDVTPKTPPSRRLSKSVPRKLSGSSFGFA